MRKFFAVGLVGWALTAAACSSEASTDADAGLLPYGGQSGGGAFVPLGGQGEGGAVAPVGGQSDGGAGGSVPVGGQSDGGAGGSVPVGGQSEGGAGGAVPVGGQSEGGAGGSVPGGGGGSGGSGPVGGSGGFGGAEPVGGGGGAGPVGGSGGAEPVGGSGGAGGSGGLDVAHDAGLMTLVSAMTDACRAKCDTYGICEWLDPHAEPPETVESCQAACVWAGDDLDLLGTAVSRDALAAYLEAYGAREQCIAGLDCDQLLDYFVHESDPYPCQTEDEGYAAAERTAWGW